MSNIKQSRTVYPNGTDIKGYIVNGLIGQGGFADIYKVMSSKFHQEFVAKVICIPNTNIEVAWASFNSEITSLMKLDHPHIIKLYEHFQYNDRFVIILEYCTRGSLVNEVENFGRFSEQRLYTVSKQICSALSYAHKQRIAHHDLKPQNILFDSFGRAKIADFGISIQQSMSVLANDFQCSIAYAPPEIIQKKLHSPFIADIWSLGITFVYAATGDLPFDVRTMKGLKMSILNGTFSFKKPLPPPYLEIVKEMLKLQPSLRPNMLELYERFEILAKQFEEEDNNIGSPLIRQSSSSLLSARRNSSFLLQNTKIGYTRKKTLLPKQPSFVLDIPENFPEAIVE